jgi:uncharacterized protein YecT (DUF1311 family)
MRQHYALIFSLIITMFSCSTSAAPNCDNASGQTEELFCAQLQYKKIDIELNTLYSSIVTKFNKDQVALLLTSQKSWISMRDSYCDVLTYENKGTTSWETERTSCLTMITQERVQQLKKLVD